MRYALPSRGERGGTKAQGGADFISRVAAKKAAVNLRAIVLKRHFTFDDEEERVVRDKSRNDRSRIATAIASRACVYVDA